MKTISNVARRMREGEGGFTLIELMITVAVIAILAAIAYPSYTTSVRKGKRGQAKADLLVIAQMMERCYTQNNTYLGCFAGNALAAPFDQSPREPAGSTAMYTVALNPAVTAQGYRIVATPVGDQLKDTCGNLLLDQAGRRTFSGTGTNCW